MANLMKNNPKEVILKKRRRTLKLPIKALKVIFLILICLFKRRPKVISKAKSRKKLRIRIRSRYTFIKSPKTL